MIKSHEELQAIQAAVDITSQSLMDVVAAAKTGKYTFEYEIEAELTAGFRKRGGSGHAFDPIVAGGARACTLHNVANNSQLSRDELIIIDVGAEVEHYAADITRTIALQKSPASRLSMMRCKMFNDMP
jgi:Xaa-Pro aminopeptidase